MSLMNLSAIKMRRRNYKFFVCALVLVYTFYFCGVADYINSRDFELFDYPLNVDIKPLIQEVMANKKPSLQPINYYPFKFLTNSGKCKTLERLDLFIIVKSAMDHAGHRMAIRETYGQENFIPGRIVKTLFFLGVDKSPNSALQKEIEQEMDKYKDIIQIDFLDNYYNNTIKTMMSFRWVFEHCPTADFYLFTDDDMYISVTNLLDYVHYRAFKPTEKPSKEDSLLKLLEIQDSEKDRHLFAGYVFESKPQRFKSSKWRVSLEEYPWNKWPPYVTAGAYVLSNISMKTVYIGSFFVKHFRFDDIYLAIIAKKAGITPTHCEDFHFYKKPYTKEGYTNVIASHGYGDHEELIRVWNEQNNPNAV